MKFSRITALAVVTALFLSLTVACETAQEPNNVSDTDENGSVSQTTDTGENTQSDSLDLNADIKGATEHTSELNHSCYEHLDFNDEREFEKAQRGLIAAPEQLEIHDSEGKLVYSQKAFEFVKDTESPDTANPSLWRHTQLNHNYGLYEVTEGIYQVRGYDLTNFTFIEGETGWIVFDTGTTVETMQAALAFINETLGERPVVAVIVSHSHGDHYGGLRGVVSEEQLLSGEIPIIVPEGFEKAAISENLYAGSAMFRRAFYQYGYLLPPPGPQSKLAIGLGTETPDGFNSYLAPTDHITYTGETRTIDGVEMVFHMTPGTEAPAEMNTWFPAKNALWMAENCVGTLHNLYTLRGAQVRDGNTWAYYLMEALTLYGDDVEVIFQSHNWPCWGNEEIKDYMIGAAAVYKFINDQSLMYINQGYTSAEIAEIITLPDVLEQQWHTRPYYGTYKHNAKAVYQKYMGWYSGNPADLDPLPPTERAKKFVEYLGDTDKVLELAKRDFDNGEYRWVAEIMSVLVFADPTNMQARYLGADALEQLGYQSEAGTWRATYLTGAQELRNGVSPEVAERRSRGSGDITRSLEPYMVFEYLGIRLDSNAAQDINLKANINLTGDKSYLLTVKSGVILYQENVSDENADVTITMPRQAVSLLTVPNLGEGNESEQVAQMNAVVTIDGDKEAFMEIYKHLVEFDTGFNVIEP
ncbi:MAG: MBL fold metallo-hydrolase [Oscillospiraceae bacterium]|nr:MBL fold metallo-hydrolase [Oscillospiraceae bacterium]